MPDEKQSLPSVVPDTPEDPPVTQAQAEELDRRVEAYRQNPRKGVAWEQVAAKLHG